MLIMFNKASDASSYYEPHPTLTYEWDPQTPEAMTRSISHFTATGKSFDLSPHPADPHSNDAIPELNGYLSHSNTTRKESVPGYEIWVYEDPRGRYVHPLYVVRLCLLSFGPIGHSRSGDSSFKFL